MGRVGATTLQRLATATGGTAYFPPARTKATDEAADLDEIYARIVDDLRAHYVLSYYSDVARDDARNHALRVDVSRPGVTVTSRGALFSAHFAPLDSSPAPPQ
jgi:hypothetical protein